MARALSGQADVHLEELRDRVSWLIRLRWLAIAGVLATVALVPHVVGVRLEQRPLYLTTAGLALYNVGLIVIKRWIPQITTGRMLVAFANAQITLDLIFLTALLHFAGGIENPFVVYYVFHVVIASILLSRAATYLQVGLAMALLAGVAGLEATGLLRHHHLEGLLISEQLHQSPQSVLAYLFAVGTMLSLTAFMATSITARLRARESEILRLSASLRQHAEDLERAYEALRQVEQGKSDYLHRVAHHLRSPLATVENLLAVIAEGRTGEIPARSQEMLARARARVRNMLDLARDLLTLSRSREAVMMVARRPVDIGALIAEVLRDYQGQAAEASVALDVSVEPDLLQVAGDPESLAELLDNLVSNAIKYTPAGGQVRVTAARQGDEVVLAVSDTGIGVPPEERERVFEEFYRATNARETGKEGTGLGLSIVRAIVDAHQGRIEVESDPGRGSTFRALLPASSAPRSLAT